MSDRNEIERIANQMAVAVYLVTEEGKFLVANQRLRDMLGLPAGDISHRSIAEFYADPSERNELVTAVLKNGQVLEKQTVTFAVGHGEIQVQMFCNASYGEDGSFLGFLGVVVEVTGENEYRGVFDAHLPAGVYRLDENDLVTHANAGFAKVHGYDSVADVKGKNARDFYADPADAKRVGEQARSGNVLHRERALLRRRSGESFPAYITIVPFFSRLQTYLGRGGVVEDRTREEQYERLSSDIPVGFYVIEMRDGKDVVVDCNDEFARIFNLPSRGEMLNRDVSAFHESPDETTRLRELLAEAVRTSGVILGEQFRIRTARGNLKTIEVNVRPHMRDDEIVGRTGAIRDITAEVEMRDIITTLTSDIGAILHTFRHTLTQLKHSVASVADVLAGAPNTRQAMRSPEELELAVRGPMHELSAAVESFMAAVGHVTHAVPLEQQDRDNLLRIVGVMQHYRDDIPKAHWRDVWRNGAVEILGIFKRVRSGTVARSTTRPVIDAAAKIATITSVATLSVAREAIAAVEAPVASLYEFVTSGIRRIDRSEVLAAETCVTEAINNLTGFADERKVRIRFDDRTRTMVAVSRVEITRAIGNLLHNAIKYSWKRDEAGTWVAVSVTATEQSTAVVAVENWGVPIPSEEIEQKMIFRLGFRGRLSSDRGRMGTGVGLADSLRVAHAHGGGLRILSRPASGLTTIVDYKQPFITTALLELPLWRIREAEGR